MEKKAICISTDDDTEALLSKFPSDRSKREKKDNKQDDFLYGSDLATKSSSDDNDDDDSDDDNAARRPQVKSFALKPLPECPIDDVGSGISTNVQSTELEAGTCSLSSPQKQTDACTSDPPLHRKRKRTHSTPINDSSGSSSSTAAEFSLSNSCTENDSEDVSRIEHGNFCCAGCRQIITLRLKTLERQLTGLALLLQNNDNEVNTNSAASKKIPHVTELPVQTLLQFTEFEKKLKKDIQLRHDFRTCRRSFQTLLLENLRCHFKNGYVEVEIKFAVFRDLQVG
ncbi:uncharacterized protein [Temnothorax longispinosus]|uniref:uncharacterized protein n=1 Tax=Temnothorax longispinosus TaxID=300112 RepID=UPI003A9A321C